VVGFAVLAECVCTTASPTRNVLFRTVPAFCAALIGSNSDSRIATLPNGASAAYRAVACAGSGATVAASSSRTAKFFASSEAWQGQASRRRTRTGTSPNRERNVAL
jgi:hypothetical protein